MATALGDCKHGCEPESDKCARIRQRIHELMHRNKHTDPPSTVFSAGSDIHGLYNRIGEQVFGKFGPGMVDPESGKIPWDTHDANFRGQQGKLEKELEALEANKCGDPPPGAWTLATRDAPAPSEWVGPEQGLGHPDVELFNVLPIGKAFQAGKLGWKGLQGAWGWLKPAIP
jgi:hypothetical protein